MKTIKTLALAASLALLPISQASAYVVSLFNAEPMTNLTQADSAINNKTATTSFTSSIIEFDDLGDGTQGLFLVNNAWGITPPDTFAARITGAFNIETAGTWQLGVNHDDGMRLLIDGVLVATADGVADNRNTIVTFSNLSAGYHTLEIIYFENGGGASLEFFGRQGTTGDFKLIQSVPEPASLALVGLSLLGLGLSRRKSA